MTSIILFRQLLKQAHLILLTSEQLLQQTHLMGKAEVWVGPTSCNAPKSLIRWYYVFLFRPYPSAVKLSYFPIYRLFFSFSFFNALFGNRRGKIKLFRHDSFFYLVGIIVNKWGESGRSAHPSRSTFLIWAEIRRERQVKSLQFLRTHH